MVTMMNCISELLNNLGVIIHCKSKNEPISGKKKILSFSLCFQQDQFELHLIKVLDSLFSLRLYLTITILYSDFYI